MTTVASIAQLLTTMAPEGGIVAPCTEDGTPLLGPGNYETPVAAVVAADAEHPSLIRLRFGPPAGMTAAPGTSLTTYTATPWTQLPGGSWVLPQMDAAGQTQGWLLFHPVTGDPPIHQEIFPT